MKKLIALGFVILLPLNSVVFSEESDPEEPQYLIGSDHGRGAFDIEKQLENSGGALYFEVKNVFIKNWYKDISDREFAEKILQGGISTIDRYSRYLNKTQAALMAENTEGKFYGIGMYLGQKISKGKTYLSVMSVISGGAAEKAGLKSGDYIVGVSSEGRKESAADVRNMGTDEVVFLIRGRPGTKVFLLIMRGGEMLEFIIAREEVKIETMESRIIKKGVGYLRINEFRGEDNFEADLNKILADFKKTGVKALIMDLRSNPGGLLKLAIITGNLFAEPRPSGIFRNQSGPPIVHIKRKNPQNSYNITGYSSETGKFRDFKLVVLVNEGSASASEIVSAYLKHYCGAKLVGKKTFGKGVGQEVRSLASGGILIVTNFQYLVGERQVAVDGIGVEPDYEVDNPEEVKSEEDDKQLQVAIGAAEETLIKK